MDKVTLIIPVYNSEEFIEDTIKSAIHQSHPASQVIVVDDGSTDGTRDILAKYTSHVEVVRQTNAGPSAARNNGIKHASGDYICFLDSDDKFLSRKIERQLGVFHYRQDVGLVHTGVNMIRKNGEHWYSYIPPNYFSREDQIQNLLKSNYIVNSSVMVRRDVLSQVGQFNESYRFAEDYDMWLRFLVYCNLACVPEVLCEYRWHDHNLSRTVDVSIVERIKKEARVRFAQA